MKKLLASFFLLCFLNGFCQTKYPVIDSLLQEAVRYGKVNQDSALVYSEKAHLLAKKQKDTLAIATSGYYYATYLILLKKYEAAEEVLSFNIKNKEQLSAVLVGDSYYNLASLNDYQEHYDLALENYFIALANYEVSESKKRLAKTNLQIGVVYSKLDKKELANYFYQNAMPGAKISPATKNTDSLKSIYEEQAVTSRNMLKGLAPDSDERTRAIILYNLATALKRTDKCEEAIPFLQQSIAIKERIKLNAQIDKSYVMLGACYAKTGKPDLAIQALTKAKNITTKRQQTAIIEVELANAFQQKGDFKNALLHFKNYKKVSDSIFQLNENDRIAEITSRFETEKQADEIKVLEANSLLKDSKLSNQKNILWATAIGVLLLLSCLFFAYNRYKTKQQLQFSEMTRKLLQMQLNPHFLFNALNGIQFFIKKNDTKKSSKYISNFSGLMRNILENSVEKFISIEEDAETISDFLALQQLVHNNAFTFSVDIDEQLDPDAYAIPPMFTQPFVENAIIHGVKGLQDGHIQVKYGVDGDLIKIEIKDNGKGIIAKNKDANTLHKSMGTSITKQRMENLLKSENYPITLEVVSKKEENLDHGTQVTLTFIKKYI